MIEALQSDIVARIATDLPDVTVDRHTAARLDEDDVRRMIVRMPCVMVSLIGTGEVDGNVPSGQIALPLEWAAFALTRHDPSDPSGSQCANLAIAAAAAIHDQHLGSPYPSGPMVGLARVKTVQNMTSTETIQRSFHVWVVTFTTSVRACTDAWAVPAGTPTLKTDADITVTEDNA